jgi:hypothetical protein
MEVKVNLFPRRLASLVATNQSEVAWLALIGGFSSPLADTARLLASTSGRSAKVFSFKSISSIQVTLCQLASASTQNKKLFSLPHGAGMPATKHVCIIPCTSAVVHPCTHVGMAESSRRIEQTIVQLLTPHPTPIHPETSASFKLRQVCTLPSMRLLGASLQQCPCEDPRPAYLCRLILWCWYPGPFAAPSLSMCNMQR